MLAHRATLKLDVGLRVSSEKGSSIARRQWVRRGARGEEGRGEERLHEMRPSVWIYILIDLVVMWK